jgi:hypothetical protein
MPPKPILTTTRTRGRDDPDAQMTRLKSYVTQFQEAMTQLQKSEHLEFRNPVEFVSLSKEICSEMMDILKKIHSSLPQKDGKSIAHARSLPEALIAQLKVLPSNTWQYNRLTYRALHNQCNEMISKPTTEDCGITILETFRAIADLQTLGGVYIGINLSIFALESSPLDTESLALSIQSAIGDYSAAHDLLSEKYGSLEVSSLNSIHGISELRNRWTDDVLHFDYPGCGITPGDSRCAEDRVSAFFATQQAKRAWEIACLEKPSPTTETHTQRLLEQRRLAHTAPHDGSFTIYSKPA